MVSPYMTNPFAGLQQGMQAAGGLIDMYNAPRDRAFAMEQARQKMALQQAQLGQGQQRIDLETREQDRLAQASQREQEQAQTLAFGRLAKIYQTLPEEEREQFLMDTKALHGLDPKDVSESMIKNLSASYDALSTKDQNVRRSEILSDGTVIAVTDKGQKVYDPSGKLLSGQAAADQVAKANEYKLQQSLETARMGARGKAEEDRRQEIMNGAYKAKSTIPTINNMLSLLDTVETSGFDAAKKKFTDFFGTTPRDVGQFDALAKSLVLQNLRALGSNPTEGERAFIESTSASLSQGGEVNKAILSQMKEIAQRQIKQGRFIAGGGTPEQLLADQPVEPPNVGPDLPPMPSVELPKIGDEIMPGVKRIK